MSVLHAITNGHKTTIIGFLSGAGIVLFALLISALVTVGSERQKVMGYIEDTKPLDIASTAHRADSQIHVSPADKAILATVPLELRNIHDELRKINLHLDTYRPPR